VIVCSSTRPDVRIRIRCKDWENWAELIKNINQQIAACLASGRRDSAWPALIA
jgi:hypothetical protein